MRKCVRADGKVLNKTGDNGIGKYHHQKYVSYLRPDLRFE